MGAAAVTLRVRLVAEYAGLNCLPLPSARPLIVANWPVREPLPENSQHSTFNLPRAEAIHDGQIEQPVERGRTRFRHTSVTSSTGTSTRFVR